MNRASPYFPLTSRVDVSEEPSRGWQTIAAFNVECVALRYAANCRKANPFNCYRTMTRTSRGWEEAREESR